MEVKGFGDRVDGDPCACIAVDGEGVGLKEHGGRRHVDPLEREILSCQDACHNHADPSGEVHGKLGGPGLDEELFDVRGEGGVADGARYARKGDGRGGVRLRIDVRDEERDFDALRPRIRHARGRRHLLLRLEFRALG